MLTVRGIRSSRRAQLRRARAAPLQQPGAKAGNPAMRRALRRRDAWLPLRDLGAELADGHALACLLGQLAPDAPPVSVAGCGPRRWGSG